MTENFYTSISRSPFYLDIPPWDAGILVVDLVQGPNTAGFKNYAPINGHDLSHSPNRQYMH